MKRIGKYTLEIEKECYIIGRSSLVGDKEKNGTFKDYMKKYIEDDKIGEKTFEKSERKMLEIITKDAVKNAGLKLNNIDLYLGGDLTNQIVSTNYVAEILGVPFVGIYSACSTITACLGIAGVMIDAGGFNNILCSSISHFSSAERQYRFPLEFGNQRQSYSQWTVTAGGGFVVSNRKGNIKLTRVCFSKVQDYGVVDIANMGAAMAVAASDTLCNFFNDTHTLPEDYDLIATGDLGKLGSDILRDLMLKKKFDLGQKYADIGHSIYLFEEEAYQGGSGAGCSSSVLATYIWDKLMDNTFRKVLIVATGALMSTTTNQQGDAIPSVAHLIEIERV